jgi:meckelin
MKIFQIHQRKMLYWHILLSLLFSLLLLLFNMVLLDLYLVIRHLVKIWKPLPYEDFVDLCCISNISLMIFDQERHGYYLHGMNPLGQA